MSVKRLITLTALFLAATLILSACFSVRSFYWSRKSAVPGGSINAVLNLRPYSTNSVTGYPFILIGQDSASDYGFGSLRVWDDDGNFDGPKTLVKDNALRNWLLAQNFCSYAGVDASDMTGQKWTLFRAPDMVASGTNVNKNAQVKFRINVPATASAGEVETMVFFSGTWNDDGSGTPGSPDTAGCTGQISSGFPIVAP